MLKQDRHYLNAVAEELASLDSDTPAKPIRNDGPRVQDGASYFHGVYGKSAVKSSVFFGVAASGVVKSSVS